MSKPKPKITALYRCQLTCKIGKDICEGNTKPPEGINEHAYFMYLLLCAIEELAKGVEEAKQ